MLEYQVLRHALLLLQSIEEGKWDLLSETSGLKLRLIRLIQLLSQYLWQRQINSVSVKSPLQSSNATPNVPIYLYHCLLFFTETTTILTNQDYNYFGCFEQSVIKIETEIVLEFLTILIDGLDHHHAMYHSLYRLLLCLPVDSEEEVIRAHFQQEYASALSFPSEMSDVDRTVSSEGYPCLFVQLFWIKFFQYQLSVPWSDFSQAFLDFYSIDHSYTKQSTTSSNYYDAFQTFKQLLLNEKDSLPPPPVSTPYPSYDLPSGKPLLSSAAFVDFPSLRDFCLGYHSLFQAFQEKCDPQTTLCVAGAIIPNSMDFKTPSLIKSLSGLHITHVSCGDQHIAVVSATGQLYTWGKGDYGRLGQGHEFDIKEPTLVTTLSEVPIQYVSCGFAYTIAICSSHKLYSWGAGGNGRLGHGNETNTFLPMLVRAMVNESARVVCAGSVHTCILTKEGKVFTCGKAAYVGHGNREDCLLPALLDRFQGEVIEKISVSTGGFHTLVLTKSRKVYSWGHNRVGQLGIPSTLPGMERYDDGGLYLPYPEVVRGIPDNIVDINAGWGHSSLITETGEVYVCGRNEEGQLGGDLATRKVWKAACGGEHSMFYCGDYDLIGIGKSPIGHNSSSNTSTASTTTATPSLTSSLFRKPALLPFFLSEKREILQISSAYSSMVVLLGKRQPSSLRKLCSDVIRMNPEVLTITANVIESEASEREEEKGDDKASTEPRENISVPPSQLVTAKVETLSNEFKEFILSHLV